WGGAAADPGAQPARAGRGPEPAHAGGPSAEADGARLARCGRPPVRLRAVGRGIRSAHRGVLEAGRPAAGVAHGHREAGPGGAGDLRLCSLSSSVVAISGEASARPVPRPARGTKATPAKPRAPSRK